MTKIFRRSALVIALSVLVVGFSSYAVYQAFTSAPGTPVAGAVSFTRPSPAALPPEVRNWVENSLRISGYFINSQEFDGKQYLLVIGGGARSLELNHLVEITDVVVEREEVVVKAKFTRRSLGQAAPDKPDFALQNAHDFSYDVVYITATGLPVRFLPPAHEEIFIGALVGIHYLPDIVAYSGGIRVFAPAPGKVVGRTFRVSGVALAFEATINYHLSDARGNILGGGFITALQQAPGFTRVPVLIDEWPGAWEWRYFTMDIQVPESVVAGDDLILVLSPYDPVSPSERKVLGPLEQVRIPLKFQSR